MPPTTAPGSSNAAGSSGSNSGTNYSSAIGEYLAPFHTAVSQGLSSTHSLSGAQHESSRILADLAPHIMRPRIVAAAANASNSVTSAVSSNALIGFLPIPLSFKGQGMSLTQPARNLVRIANVIRNGPVTSHDLLALENSHQILADAALSISAGYADEEEQQSAMALTRARQASSSLTAYDDQSASASQVSLLRGFEATIPSAKQARSRRRRERAREGPRLGLKQMGDRARGLLTDGDVDSPDASFDASVASPSRDARRKERQAMRSKAKDIPLSEESLHRQSGEVTKEKDDIDVRRRLLHTEVAQVDLKIAALQAVKDSLVSDLLALKEEELELDDEQAGIQELISMQKHRRNMPGQGGEVKAHSSAGGKHTKSKLSHSSTNPTAAAEGHAQKNALQSSRRRKGPMFLPSEHDELPSNVAFMTLTGHTAPITALDFSEPYGALVTAAADGDSSTRVWDLSSGYEVGRLRHDALVKALQVEDELCITGGADANVKIWDLRKVEDWETRLEMKANGEEPYTPPRSANQPERSGEQDTDVDALTASSDNLRQGGTVTPREDADPKLMTLEGHSKEVTALYFDDTCLVTGASDKTLRQWDLNTGQCVLTMDILWAISNPTASQALGISTPSPPSPDFSNAASPTPSPRRPGIHSRDTGTGLMTSMNQSDWSGNFSYPTPPYADGSWELYTDFVGSSAIQFWGYALASGSSDGAVRMWDMRTGQSHRTLLGHTAPVTTLQFDESYVISGSLDRSIRIWDLRTGSIAETIKYDYPVTKLQFDSRKIMVADGKNGVDVFNRTTFQHSTLEINGHTKPAERLRYMDRYAVTGGKDAVVKVWAL